MSIKINTNVTDITVYDRYNLNHATRNNVVPLITSNRGNFKTLLINIISHTNRFIESEIELYTSIIHIGNAVFINYLIKYCVDNYKKSHTTYHRAISSLITKGVIRYYDGQHLHVNPNYDVNQITDTAKYIVIEVKAND